MVFPIVNVSGLYVDFENSKLVIGTPWYLGPGVKTLPFMALGLVLGLIIGSY